MGRQSNTSATVLVVDDDQMIRHVFVAALSRAGYRTLDAASGEAALKLLVENEVDVALIDLEMPGLSGLDLATRVRADQRHESISIIFVSGHGTLNSKLAGLQAGGNDYLVKPLALEELLARVAAHLRDRTRWLERLDRQLAARSKLARRIAELDSSTSLPVLERELLSLLSTELRIQDVALLLDLPAVMKGDDELSIRHAGDVVRVRVPLRAGGALVGFIEASVDGPPQQAVSTLSDLSPQIGAVVAEGLASRGTTAEDTGWVRDLIDGDGLGQVYQPVVMLPERRVVGYEGLTRFADGTPPDVGFARAAAVRAGTELERAAIERLIAGAAHLPETAWLSLNLSATTLMDDGLAAILATASRPLVLELTENEHVEDYAAVRDRLAQLPGVQLAVDDAGAGYASLRHIFELRPHFIKLDRSWITGIDHDPVRQALVRGVLGFSRAFDARVVAEGVERAEEENALTRLGVPMAQGYAFGRPEPALRTVQTGGLT